jgi:regulator of protease activity HflC (stomatin/prohibitin superfamily)
MVNKWDDKVDEDKTVKNVVKYIFIGLMVVLGVIVLFSTFYTVESGTEAVLLTWDKAEPVGIGPGFHFKIPIAQRVVAFDMRTQKYGADATQSTLESAASSDLQVVKMRVVVNYHLSTGTSPTIFSTLGANYQDKVITPTVHEITKATTAQFTATDLINKREAVRAEMENILKARLVPYNIIVEQVSITDFDFSEQFNTAIENKVTAEQLKQKAEMDLQRITVEAEQVSAAAKGQRDAAIANAEGAAKTIELNARAEALKIQLIQDQLKQSPQYIELQKVQKWNGAYPNFYMTGGQSPTLLMQVPSPATN